VIEILWILLWVASTALVNWLIYRTGRRRGREEGIALGIATASVEATQLTSRLLDKLGVSPRAAAEAMKMLEAEDAIRERREHEIEELERTAKL
jgi:hypothetical protein